MKQILLYAKLQLFHLLKKYSRIIMNILCVILCVIHNNKQTKRVPDRQRILWKRVIHLVRTQNFPKN